MARSHILRDVGLGRNCTGTRTARRLAIAVCATMEAFEGRVLMSNVIVVYGLGDTGDATPPYNPTLGVYQAATLRDVDDLAGNERIYGSGVDIGAFEYQGTALATVSDFTIRYSDEDDTIVDNLRVTFSELVTLGTLVLYSSDGTAMPMSVSASDDNQTYTLTFPSSLSSEYSGNALPSGQYMLTVQPMANSLNGSTELFAFTSA